jgi:y4mF family transcriptional regulator
MDQIRIFIKDKRKELKLTQYDLAERAGVGIRVIRDLEQGRETLKANTLIKILRLFGKTLGPVDL